MCYITFDIPGTIKTLLQKLFVQFSIKSENFDQYKHFNEYTDTKNNKYMCFLKIVIIVIFVLKHPQIRILENIMQILEKFLIVNFLPQI